MGIFQRYKKWLQWLIASVCVLGIIWFFAKNKEKISLLLEIDTVCIAKLIALTLAGHLIYTFRFQLVLEKCGKKKIPIPELVRIVILGRYLSTFIPQAGNLYRGIVLKSDYGISYTRYASSFLSFTWLEICFNLLLALAVSTVGPYTPRFGKLHASIVLGAIFFCVAILPVLAKTLLGFVKFRNSRLMWCHGRLSELFSVISDSFSDSVFLLKFGITGLLTFGTSIAILHVSFMAIQMHTQIPVLAFFCVVLQFFNQIVITPGNMGVREIAYGIISDQTNIGAAEGIIVSVIIRMAGTVVIIVAGTFLGGLGLLKTSKPGR